MTQPKQPKQTKQLEPRYCLNCGRELTPSWGGRPPLFCGPACKMAYRRAQAKQKQAK